MLVRHDHRIGPGIRDGPLMLRWIAIAAMLCCFSACSGAQPSVAIAQQVADAVAADLGIDEVFAGVLPGDKSDKVAELQDRGYKVAMVGDGVNDAPALARADVGVAIGAGTDVAIESAGIVLVSSDPRAVLSAIELSHASYRKMVQNLVWATAYNVISVPLAAGVLAPIGFTLPPAAAAVLMSLSTIIVALNAQLLRRHELDPE